MVTTAWTQTYYRQIHRERDTVPSPSSCLVNRQSSGHSWGRLGLCTRLCETVARCPSALQTPCWLTTAAAGRHNTHTQRSCQTFWVNAVILSLCQMSRMKKPAMSVKTCPSPVLYGSHSCGGNSGGRSSSSTWQFSDTLKKAGWDKQKATGKLHSARTQLLICYHIWNTIMCEDTGWHNRLTGRLYTVNTDKTFTTQNAEQFHDSKLTTK